MTARPGALPPERALIASTRSFSSTRMVAAVALPSMMIGPAVASALAAADVVIGAEAAIAVTGEMKLCERPVRAMGPSARRPAVTARRASRVELRNAAVV